MFLSHPFTHTNISNTPLSLTHTLVTQTFLTHPVWSHKHVLHTRLGHMSVPPTCPWVTFLSHLPHTVTSQEWGMAEGEVNFEENSG